MTATASLQARRRLARNGEQVTVRTITRNTSVDATTGQHTWTTSDEAANLDAIITDVQAPGSQSRNVTDERDINIKTYYVRVEAGVPVQVGQYVEIVTAHDAELVGLVGKVTDVKRSGRMFKRFTFTTEATP